MLKKRISVFIIINLIVFSAFIVMLAGNAKGQAPVCGTFSLSSNYCHKDCVSCPEGAIELGDPVRASPWMGYYGYYSYWVRLCAF